MWVCYQARGSRKKLKNAFFVFFLLFFLFATYFLDIIQNKHYAHSTEILNPTIKIPTTARNEQTHSKTRRKFVYSVNHALPIMTQGRLLTENLLLRRGGKYLRKWKDVLKHQSKVFNKYGAHNLVINVASFGLGNKMFMYAAAKSIAKHHNRTFIYNPIGRDILSESFNLSYATKDYRHLNTNGYLCINTAYCCIFHPDLYNLPDENIILDGYLQSWKYLEPEIIEKEFIFNNRITVYAKQFHENVKKKLGNNFVVIGVHIRRGDHLKPALQKYGFTVADKSYLDKAISHFRRLYPLSHFIVATNDLIWSQNNLQEYDSSITFTNQIDPAVDMCILSLCDHVIMTVGTFGWWAGYLSGGDVVYYKSWPKPGSTYHRSVHKNEYFLPNWIGL